MNLRNFRYIALVEATSFLALLVASYVKRANDAPLGVEILGPIHGALFIAYVLVALLIREDAGWTAKQTAGILLGAVLPFGGYVVDWYLRDRDRDNRGDAVPADDAAEGSRAEPVKSET